MMMIIVINYWTFHKWCNDSHNE